MKNSSFAQLVGAIRLRAIPLTRIASLQAIAILALIAQPSTAEGTTFFCGTSNGTPATLARTPQGEIPIILWTSEYFKDREINPQQHCEQVSQRFQTYYDNGTLNYITTERMNGQLVACVAQTAGGACSGELFALKSGESNPRRTLQRLLRIRVPADGPISETGTRVYISLEKYLNGEYPTLVPLRSRPPRPEPGNSPR